MKIKKNKSITASAPGKINLSLGVSLTKKNGYHNIDTIFQAVNLREYITLKFAKRNIITIKAKQGIDISEVPLDKNNLAFKAVSIISQLSNKSAPVKIHIYKEVPPIGGMASGSADAAAALIAANELFQTKLNKVQLNKYASKLGADVPFVLNGFTAHGSSKGHILKEIKTKGLLYLVIIISKKSLLTSKVFEFFDRCVEKNHSPHIVPSLKDVLNLNDPYLITKLMGNDLQKYAIKIMPNISDILLLGEKHPLVIKSMISGSGPSVIFLTKSRHDAINVSLDMQEKGHTAFVCLSPDEGARLESIDLY